MNIDGVPKSVAIEYVARNSTCIFDFFTSSGHHETRDRLFAYLRSAPIKIEHLELWGTEIKGPSRAILQFDPPVFGLNTYLDICDCDQYNWDERVFRTFCFGDHEIACRVTR